MRRLFEKRRVKLCSIGVLMVVQVLLFGCTGKSSEEQSVRDKIRLKELDGRAIDLKAYKGKTVFINLWATWCGPCVKEMPSIERAMKALNKSDIEFLLASNEDLDAIQAFIDKRKLDLHYVQLENLEELNTQALPTTFIISPTGEVVFSETGYREWDQPENIELLTKISSNHE